MSTTETLAGMHLTGRRVAGPGTDLVELESEDGVLHTAIVLDEKFRGDGVIVQAVELARGFMEFPMVTGLVEMSSFLPAEGALVYPTGNTRSLAEVIKYYRESKGKFSKRAALELLYLAGQVLQEASETGPLQGVYSHGDLTPARILIREDGDVQVIGYGLPNPEVLAWVRGGKVEPHVESLYYTPPERLQDAPEDVTSDLYSLACIAVEVITGDPLFTAKKADDLKKSHMNAEGPALVNKLSRGLGAPVADILQYCVNFDPRNRYDDGNAFITAIGELLEGIAGGESLEESVKAVHARKTGRTLRNADATQAIPRPGAGGPARGRSIRPPARPQAGQDPDAGGRWGKVSRGKEEEAAEPEEEEAKSRRRRRRRSSTEDEEAKAAAAAAEAEAKSSRGRRRRRTGEPEEEPAEDVSASRRRRRRRTSEDEEEEKPAAKATKATKATKAAEPEEEEEEVSASSRRRRRRRSGSDDEEPEAKKAEPAKEEEEEEPSSSRRRRRSSAADKKEEPEEEEAPSSRRRTRRSSASTDDKEEEDSAGASSRRRRRSSASEDSDDEDDDSGSTSRRRTRRKRK